MIFRLACLSLPGDKPMPHFKMLVTQNSGLEAQINPLQLQFGEWPSNLRGAPQKIKCH
jgi:hypothetical protein